MRMKTFAAQLLSGAGEVVVGSEEQDRIWEGMAEGQEHRVVNAVAGRGKSFTCLEGAKRIKARSPNARIVYLAFNKSVQAEMQSKAGSSVEAMTFHSLGFAAVRHEFGGAVKVNAKRMWDVVEGVLDWSARSDRVLKAGVVKLAGLAKQYGYGVGEGCERNGKGEEMLRQIVDRHLLDFGAREEQVVGWVPKVLETAKQVSSGEIDFDDMIWLPPVLGLSLPQSDLVLSDESQDLNPVQQWAALNAGERLMIVGDRNQAIYGFRGADIHSIDNLAARVKGTCLEFPLSYTRRCPHSHVRLAQSIVPHIKALEGAPEGEEGVVDARELLTRAQVGDMMLCRVNAPLIRTAYALIGAGKKAKIMGREIADGILKLVSDIGGADTGDMRSALKWASDRTNADVARFMSLPQGRGEARAAAAQDRMSCLVAVAEGCACTAALRAKLELVFGDEQGPGIKLGTIHKLKGMEADRVYVLSPELLPHPMAKQPWERAQEMNCLYVALTRSRWGLWFVGQKPPCLEDAPPAPPTTVRQGSGDRAILELAREDFYFPDTTAPANPSPDSTRIEGSSHSLSSPRESGGTDTGLGTIRLDGAGEGIADDASPRPLLTNSAA